MGVITKSVLITDKNEKLKTILSCDTKKNKNKLVQKSIKAILILIIFLKSHVRCLDLLEHFKIYEEKHYHPNVEQKFTAPNRKFNFKIRTTRNQTTFEISMDIGVITVERIKLAKYKKEKFEFQTELLDKESKYIENFLDFNFLNQYTLDDKKGRITLFYEFKKPEVNIQNYFANIKQQMLEAKEPSANLIVIFQDEYTRVADLYRFKDIWA